MKYINYRIHTDVDPFEILEWVSEKKVIVRELKAELINAKDLKWDPNSGFPICQNNRQQEYKYTQDETNIEQTMTLRKDGFWQFFGVATSRIGFKGKLSEEPYKFYDMNF